MPKTSAAQIDIHYERETGRLKLLLNGYPPPPENCLSELPAQCAFNVLLEKLPQLIKRQYKNKRVKLRFIGNFSDSNKLVRKLRWVNDAYSNQAIYNYGGALPEISAPAPRLRADASQKPASDAAIELETCVIATMSSGKSTLINAILGCQLLPSMQEACTATIVRIRDDDRLNGQGFSAAVIGRDGAVINQIANIQPGDLRLLNKNQDVARIDMVGDIECVPSDNVALTLIDTPGPNNARDESHRKIQEDQLSASSKAIVLYVLTPEFGSDDEWQLLRRVMKSMDQGGARGQDRFLFVLNKVDQLKKEDGSLQKMLEDLRLYLKEHGIANPRIFPIAALPALMIRRLQNRADNLDEEEREAAEMYIRRLNRNPELHLEKYSREFSGLPPLVSALLEKEVVNLRKSWNARGGAKHSNPDEALAHSGILALEAAFLEYVLKYENAAF